MTPVEEDTFVFARVIGGHHSSEREKRALMEAIGNFVAWLGARAAPAVVWDRFPKGQPRSSVVVYTRDSEVYAKWRHWSRTS